MPFQQLVIELDGADIARAEEACARLGALAVSLADAGDEPLLEPAPGETPLWRSVRLLALFAESADASVAAATLAVVLGLPPGRVGIERVEDRAWEREWLKDFRPMRFGRRLWICPTGQRPSGPAAIVLELDPGLAFGTGTHATTALCLEWLDGHIRCGERLLDYGCGSGILGIAAMKLGARAATGVDVDPRALEAARYNASVNGVRLEVLEAGATIAQSATITVANILANPLRVLAPLIAAHTRPQGRIALSGILDEQATEVIATYAPHARLEVAGRDSGWVLLAGVRT